MSLLNKILKNSGSLSEITKNEANNPALRYLEAQTLKIIRITEDGEKRMLEISSSEGISISKNSSTLSKILK